MNSENKGDDNGEDKKNKGNDNNVKKKIVTMIMIKHDYKEIF